MECYSEIQIKNVKEKDTVTLNPHSYVILESGLLMHYVVQDILLLTTPDHFHYGADGLSSEKQLNVRVRSRSDSARNRRPIRGQYSVDKSGSFPRDRSITGMLYAHGVGISS